MHVYCSSVIKVWAIFATAFFNFLPAVVGIYIYVPYMWQNLNGFYWRIPVNYEFKSAIAVFGNIQHVETNIEKLTAIANKCVVLIYDNMFGGDFERIKASMALYDNLDIILAFATINNRYSKPYTAGFEHIFGNNKIRTDLSIVVSDQIGLDLHSRLRLRIKSSTYIDRAFAHNIGISTVVTTAMFFNGRSDPVECEWPYHVVPLAIREKLFHDGQEPAFRDFIFPEARNIICINGPPYSGKTVLARRINKVIPCCIVENSLDEPTNDGTSIIYTYSAATDEDKREIISVFARYSGNINHVWIEMGVRRQVVEFLRYFRVQVTGAELESDARIREYYSQLFQASCDCINVPGNITQVLFPLVLKRVPELMFIY